jgi:mRNA-degrading endonuclease RelE of RelBE toxin-antitoxin system
LKKDQFKYVRRREMEQMGIWALRVTGFRVIIRIYSQRRKKT